MKPELTWPLEDLLPHAPPMILIDRVHRQTATGLEASVRISEDCLFFEPSRGVPAYVGLEYIAQTVAALAGLRARQAGGDIELGFLLGTRRYEAMVPWFPLGSELLIRVESEFETRDIAKYAGAITDQSGTVLVTGGVTVYRRGAESEGDDR